MATMTAPLRQARALGAPATATRRALRLVGRESVAIAALSFALYLGVAIYLLVGLHYIADDALARVANASFVLQSRDPHLAAMGFVWNPLPSFLDLPLVLFRGWLPALVNRGFAGCIQTAAFGAASAVVLNAICRDLGLGRRLRWGLVLAYALNPMIVLYSANGMSDVPFMFFLLASTHYFLRWRHRPHDLSLAALGSMLALGTLVRYEAIPFALCAFVAVALCSLRADRSWREVETRLLIVGLPVVLAVGAWVLANAVIQGDALYFAHSQYSNDAQQAATYAGRQATMALEGWLAAGSFVARESLMLFPAYALVAVLVAAGAVRRGARATGLTLLMLTTPVALMQLLLVRSGESGLWLRYFMAVIPFSFVLGAYAIAQARRRRVRLPLALLVLAALGASGAATVTAMATPDVGRQDAGVTRAVLGGAAMAESEKDRAFTISVQIDSMNRAHAPILADSFAAFPIIINSADPTMYVTTSDGDFLASLDEPRSHGVGYLLVPNPQGNGGLDAVNRRYPSLWRDGAGFSHLVRDFGGWRLYQVVGATPVEQ